MKRALARQTSQEVTTLEGEIERLHPASYGWALACCRFRRQEAEDVLQSAYLKVLDGRACYDGRSSVRTWLFAVIRKTALDARRRRWLEALCLVRWNHVNGVTPQAVARRRPSGSISAEIAFCKLSPSCRADSGKCWIWFSTTA